MERELTTEVKFTARRASGAVARLLVVGVAAVALASCTGSDAPDTTVAPTTTVLTVPETAATIPEPTTTTSTSTTTTTTTTTIPVSTIPHGAGPVTELVDGGSVDPDVAVTAKNVYDAAVAHNYLRLAEIIGDNRFRWGFVGERKPADAWKAQFEEGRGDELARIAALLDTKPATDDRGNTVWPYVALKEPETWDAADEAELLRLGFNPENILDTKAKGRYVDYRLIIDPTGRWTAFGVGY